MNLQNLLGFAMRHYWIRLYPLDFSIVRLLYTPHCRKCSFSSIILVQAALSQFPWLARLVRLTNGLRTKKASQLSFYLINIRLNEFTEIARFLHGIDWSPLDILIVFLSAFFSNGTYVLSKSNDFQSFTSQIVPDQHFSVKRTQYIIFKYKLLIFL